MLPLVPGQGLAGNLLKTAQALSHHLRHARDAFGHSDAYTALGTLDTYQTELTTMLDLLDSIEKGYQQDATALVDLTARQSYLDNVADYQGQLLARINSDIGDLTEAVTKKLSELGTMSAECEQASADVQTTLKAFEERIATMGPGITAADIVSLLTNLSFMNTKDNPFAKLMVPGQGLDLATKAIDDVASDTGSQNRTYVIRRLGTLAEDVTTFEGLKQAADGIIGPPGPDLGLLLSTRDQVQQICEDFYSKVPEARQASDAIKDYVDLCGDLNASIGEYNALLAELLAAQGDQAKVTGQQKDAAAEKAKTSDPDLPLIASFAASLYRHARQDCIEQLYLASRAYSLLSLQPYDVFEAMLGHLLPSGKEPDDLDANALKGALIEIAVQRLKADQRRISDIEAFEPDADRNRVVFTDADDPLLFALLRKDHAASFRLPPARVGDGPDRTPFTNRRDVRLNAV
jgi:hypothetical protein